MRHSPPSLNDGSTQCDMRVHSGRDGSEGPAVQRARAGRKTPWDAFTAYCAHVELIVSPLSLPLARMIVIQYHKSRTLAYKYIFHTGKQYHLIDL